MMAIIAQAAIDVTFTRRATWPAGTTCNLYLKAAGAEFDWDDPLNGNPIEAFPDGEGFGVADDLVHRTGELDDGDYVVAVTPIDPAGNEATPASETAEASVAGQPAEIPAAPAAASINGMDVTIGWPLSPDDEGE